MKVFGITLPIPTTSTLMRRSSRTSNIQNLRSRRFLWHECFHRRIRPEEMNQIKKIEVTGPGMLEGTVGAKNKFCINLHGLDITLLTIDVEGPSSTKLKRIDCGEGSSETGIQLAYKVKKPGNFVLDIKYRDYHVPGSPFEVIVKEPETEHNIAGQSKAEAVSLAPCNPGAVCTAASDSQKYGLVHSRLGELASFYVDTSKAGKGPLSVKLLYEDYHFDEEWGDGQFIQHKCTQNGWLINYIPTMEGPYTVVVKYGGEHIPGSPFSCYCYGVNRRIPFKTLLEPVTVENLQNQLLVTDKLLKLKLKDEESKKKRQSLEWN